MCRYCTELARFLVTDHDETMAFGACQLHLRRVIEGALDHEETVTVGKIEAEE